MKKSILFLLISMFPVLLHAQGHKGEAPDCAPMKNGKVCYTDREEMEGMTRHSIFTAVDKWAKKNYGKDVFLSSVASSKSKGTVSVNSKVELLLNDTDKTLVKYKMKITCEEGAYSVEVSHITYQYDPKQEKKFKTYPAEDVIANNGKSNTITLIKDPQLFCNATFFFVENLFGEVFAAVDDAR